MIVQKNYLYYIIMCCFFNKNYVEFRKTIHAICMFHFQKNFLRVLWSKFFYTTKKLRTNPKSQSDRRGSNPRSRPWQGRALPTTPLSHLLFICISDKIYNTGQFCICQMFFEKILNFFSAIFFSNFFSTFFTLFKTVKLIEKYSYNKFFIEFPFKNF